MATQDQAQIDCPYCGTRGDIHKILYGMPTSDFDFDLYEVGGCTVLLDQPNWMCRTCRWEGTRKPRSKIASQREQELGNGKFYATRTTPAIKRDRVAGYHWGYLISEGKTQCTCGFVHDSKDLQTVLEMAKPEFELWVDPFVYIRGHHNLPSCKGITNALIVEHRFLNGGYDQEASAYCQQCGKVVQEVPLLEAQQFVADHNESCSN